MQKVLVMTTVGSDMRSEAIGWSAEDGYEASEQFRATGRIDYDVGSVMSYTGFHLYMTPVHALGDGWRLLAPPTSCQQERDTEVWGKLQTARQEW